MQARLLNCDGCVLCCLRDLIVLHPECGDDPAKYETVAITHPITGARALAIAPSPPGHPCRYLGDGGCTIYADRPHICRTFDCSLAFTRMSRNMRRLRIKEGVISKEVLEQGRRKAIERGMPR